MVCKYEMILRWSEEDAAYLAEVPALPGCVAHGDTYAAAVKHAQEAIQLWIDTALECGDLSTDTRDGALRPEYPLGRLRARKSGPGRHHH
jgi:predicted RNase H-like HicB family nuclease